VVNYKDKMYLFGGECHSRSTGSYLHYNDLWAFDFSTRAWEAVEVRGKETPSRRSGHRMLVWRHYLVLFGGFYETETEVKFYDDLWIFDFKFGKDDGGEVTSGAGDAAEGKKKSKKKNKDDKGGANPTGTGYRWRKIEFSRFEEKPSARSGGGFVVHNDTAVLLGGFSKLKREGTVGGARDDASGGGKAAAKTRSILKEGKIHQDSWLLNLEPILKGENPKWERMSKSSQSPNRAGISYASGAYVGERASRENENENEERSDDFIIATPPPPPLIVRSARCYRSYS